MVSMPENDKDFIMVAEDSPNDSLVLKRLLEKQGYGVIDCEDGRTAWDMMQSMEQIKLVALFVDYLMPGMNGFELANKVRSSSRYAGLPIYLATSHAQQDLVVKASKLKIDGFIVKPVTLDKLSKPLNEVAEKVAKNNKIVFSANQVIFSEGSESKEMYRVESGTVLIRIKKGEAELPVGVIKTGEYFGEMSLILGEDRTASAVALTDVMLSKFSEKDVGRFLDNTALPIRELLVDMIHRIRRNNKLLAENDISDARLIEMLTASLDL